MQSVTIPASVTIRFKWDFASARGTKFFGSLDMLEMLLVATGDNRSQELVRWSTKRRVVVGRLVQDAVNVNRQLR